MGFDVGYILARRHEGLDGNYWFERESDGFLCKKHCTGYRRNDYCDVNHNNVSWHPDLPPLNSTDLKFWARNSYMEKFCYYSYYEANPRRLFWTYSLCLMPAFVTSSIIAWML